MKEIPLTQGKVALVDDGDYAELNKHKWCAHLRGRNWYVTRFDGETQIHMHRVIKNAPDDKRVDHINGNGLDNQRYNLRICTQQQNTQNRRKWLRTCSSAYKGVYKHPCGKYRVTIKVEGKNIHGGYWESEIAAAETYDALARKHFGEFANTNFTLHGTRLVEVDGPVAVDVDANGQPHAAADCV